jgi:hypothetical protein
MPRQLVAFPAGSRLLEDYGFEAFEQQVNLFVGAVNPWRNATSICFHANHNRFLKELLADSMGILHIKIRAVQ